MVDRQQSSPPWSQTMSRIHSPISTENNSHIETEKSLNNIPSSTKLVPLQDEKEITKPRKRNNSLIPIELMMNNSGEGGRERVALATVFGVPEYIDSKVFWDRQQHQNKQLPENRYGYVSVNSISVASRPISTSSKKDEFEEFHSKYFISSYVDSVLDRVGSNELLQLGTTNNAPTPTPSISFSLPHIPTVSKFNDLLIEDENGIDIMFPANPSSILISTPMVRADSVSSVASTFTLPSPIPTKEDVDSFKKVVVGLPEMFDLLLSDEDERFIIWGPDPILVSSSMATTTKPSSYANLYNHQYSNKPELKGFSSNTTSVQPTNRPKFKTRQPSDLLLKKAFGLKKKKEVTPIPTISLNDVPKVIEAASTHKLIEKLTNTLDYTLMTDFFLTYRDFLNPEDLCQLLISRFYWALQNDEEARRIVRIRTFVVLRHWLNNYFVHDFIGNRPLRVILTNFLNQLPRHPLVKASPRDQRIVKILKRVVRRLKKLYYNQSSSRVKVIPPPPPTAEQEHMSEKVRAKLSQNGIRKKATAHHGNMAVQDARNAAVVVVGSLNMKSSLIDSGVDSATKFRPSFGVDRYDKNEKSSVMSVTSDDSLESELSAGDTIPNESDVSDDEHPIDLEAEEDDHDRDWLKEQQETIEYFRSAAVNNQSDKVLNTNNLPVITDNLAISPEEIQTKAAPEFIQTAELTSECSSPSTPTTPNQSGIKENIVIQSKAIRRVPSEKWCKSDEDQHRSSSSPLPDELLKELDDQQSPVGLSKKLSKKSIERRKSEKNFQELVSSTEQANIPQVPPVELTKKPSLKKKKSAFKVKAEEEETSSEIDTFAAIPYESTQVVDDSKPIEKQEVQTNKQKISKAFSKVFRQSQQEIIPTPVEEEIPVSSVSNEPPVQQTTTTVETKKHNSQLVSLIAQRLRHDSIDTDDGKCTCTKCSGNSDSTSICRISSIEDRQSTAESLTDKSKKRSSKKEFGPVYLGHLHARSLINSSQIEEKQNKDENDEHDNDLDDDDESSVIPSERSIYTEAQASSSRARMSFISDITQFPRSKLIELGLPSTDSIVNTRENQLITPNPRHISMNYRAYQRPSNERCFIMYYRTSRLASQFCFIERDVLIKVGWEELIHCNWTKMDPNGNIHSASPENTQQLDVDQVTNYTRQSEKKRTDEQGIEQVIQRFNIVCQWVSSEIVRTKNVNERVKLIEKFIRLAKKCQMYSNYATLVQILLGLQSPAVARLEKTWSKVSPKCQRQLSKLTEFTSPMKNWKNIRDSMTEVAEEYGNSPAEIQVEMPGTTSHKRFKKTTRIKMPFGGCIPFLGIYLSDLVFNSEKPRYLKPNFENQKIYMANNTIKLPDCLNEPLVNFRKHRVIATVIKRVLIFQGLAMRYSFDEDIILMEKCRSLHALDATAIRELSASLE